MVMSRREVSTLEDIVVPHVTRTKGEGGGREGEYVHTLWNTSQYN